MISGIPPLNRLNSSIIGIAYMLGTALLSAVMHSAARHVTETLHPFEIVFFRNLFATLFVIPVVSRYGWSILRSKRFGLHFARSSLNVINHMLFFSAVALIPLADLVALSFTSPIFTTVLAVFIFGEIVGWRRWAAIIIAFAGTLIILRPGLENLTPGHGITLCAALTWAGVLLFIKSLSRTEHSITIVAYSTFLMIPLSLIPALFVWQWPTTTEFIWLTFIGIIAGCAQFFITQALHKAELNIVMPFDFTKLIWVSVIAFLFFEEIPDIATWTGGAIIFASGLYIANRETIKNKTKQT